MTRILAIDTSSDFGSLCLLREGTEPVESLLHSADGFAHVLFGQLETLLGRAGCSIGDVDCFAAASGPGSFTGVRVALSAVKGLADALERPVVTVSNLKALAWYGSAAKRAVVIDARRGEVYGAVYGAGLEPVAEETVGKFGAWLASLPDPAEGEFVCGDFSPFAPAARASAWAEVPVVAAPRGIAVAVAHIALAEYRAGRAIDPAGADANYVRRSDAELHWKEA